MDSSFYEQTDQWLNLNASLNSTNKSSKQADCSVLRLSEQLFDEFNNNELSSNLIEKLVQHRDMNQTFDITFLQSNCSLLTETKSTTNKYLVTDSVNEHLFATIDDSIDWDKLAKLLELNKRPFFKKILQKIHRTESVVSGLYTQNMSPM